MQELRVERGLSVRQFAELAGVAPNTAARFFRRQPVQWGIARRALDNLGIADIRPYLLKEDGDAETSFDELDAAVLAEWRVDNAMSRPITLSNGLEFRVCKLAHLVMPGTYGRGKCYDLRHLRTRDQHRVEEQLLRHPKVCRSVGPHPRFPVNERVLYSDDRSRFWVIDRWLDGISLESKLRYGPLSPALLPKVMTQILEGLSALHTHGIIRRELSPEYVFLVEPDCDVVLTELELAKLLEGSVSVSETWDEDPYRAPEIEADEIDATVDFYSWGQILVHAVTGLRPPSPAAPDLLADRGLPRAVQTIAQRCLSLSHKWRPQSVAEIHRAVKKWQ